MTITEQLIERLIDIRDGVDRDEGLGICGNVGYDTELALPLPRAFEDLGLNPLYPLGDAEFDECIDASDFWSGPLGEARLALVDRLIEHFKAQVEGDA